MVPGMRFEHVIERLETAPLVVACQFQARGRWWPARVGEWAKDETGWHAFVIEERPTAAAGVKSGGWTPLERVRPARHVVRTTFGAWQWGAWRPPDWPADLAAFAAAATNEHERR
jgi:hypothetical protein